MMNTEKKIKIKLMGYDIGALTTVLDDLRRLYAGVADFSRILNSERGGVHAYVTVYLEEPE